MKLIIRDSNGEITEQEITQNMEFSPSSGEQYFFTGVDDYTFNLTADDTTIDVHFLDNSGEKINIVLHNMAELIQQNDAMDSFSLETAFSVSTNNAGDEAIENVLANDSLESGEIVDALKEILSMDGSTLAGGAIVDDFQGLLANLDATATGDVQDTIYNPLFDAVQTQDVSESKPADPARPDNTDDRDSSIERAEGSTGNETEQILVEPEEVIEESPIEPEVIVKPKIEEEPKEEVVLAPEPEVAPVEEVQPEPTPEPEILDTKADELVASIKVGDAIIEEIEKEIVDEEANAEAGIYKNEDGVYVQLQNEAVDTPMKEEIVEATYKTEMEEFENTREVLVEFENTREVETPAKDDQIIYEMEEYVADDNIYEETFTDTREVKVPFEDTRVVTQEFENSREVEVEVAPITKEITSEEPISTNITFVVDVSSSMSNRDLDLAEAGINKIVSQYEELGNVNINIVQFYGNGNESTGWTNSDSLTVEDTLYRDKGGTDPEQGMRRAEEDFADAPQADQNIYIQMQDGNAYGSYEDDLEDYLSDFGDFINENMDAFYTVGVNVNSLRDFNDINEVIDEPNDSIFARSASDLDEVVDGIAKVEITEVVDVEAMEAAGYELRDGTWYETVTETFTDTREVTETFTNTRTEIEEFQNTRTVDGEDIMGTRPTDVVDVEAMEAAGFTQNEDGEWVSTSTETFTDVRTETETFSDTREVTVVDVPEHTIMVVDEDAIAEQGLIEIDGEYFEQNEVEVEPIMTTVTEVESVEYPIDLSAKLTDTDGSETLSDMTIDNIPEGTILVGDNVTDLGDGTYSVALDENGEAKATLQADSEIDADNLGDITATVTSTEESTGDTSTISVTDDGDFAFLDDVDAVDFREVSSEINGVDTINLENETSQTLTMETEDLINAPDEEMVILGNDGDLIDLEGEGWEKETDVSVDGEDGTFDKYSSTTTDGTTVNVYVENEITVQTDDIF